MRYINHLESIQDTLRKGQQIQQQIQEQLQQQQLLEQQLLHEGVGQRTNNNNVSGTMRGVMDVDSAWREYISNSTGK